MRGRRPPNRGLDGRDSRRGAAAPAIRLQPGGYELSVEPAVLARLGLSAWPIAFTVPSSAEGATVDGLELRLE